MYHKAFEIWYFNLGKALFKEIFGAFLFAIVMTGLTLKFAFVIMILLIIVGLLFSFKYQDPIKKGLVVGAFVIAGIIIAITGRNYKKMEAEKAIQESIAEQNENRFLWARESYELEDYLVYAHRTYCLKKDDGITYMNAIITDEKGKYLLSFIEQTDSKIEKGGEVLIQRSEDEDFTYCGIDNKKNKLYVEDFATIIVDIKVDGKDYSGDYYMVTNEDESAYYEIADALESGNDTNIPEQEVATSDLMGMGYPGEFSNPTGSSTILMSEYDMPGQDGALGEVFIYEGNSKVIDKEYYLETSGDTIWSSEDYLRLYYFYDNDGLIYYLGIRPAGEGVVLDYNHEIGTIDTYSICTY